MRRVPRAFDWGSATGVRPRGHRLSLEDIAGLVERGPELIVAGTGINGRMRPDPDLEERLAACFHLTC